MLAALTGSGTGDSPLRLPELRVHPAMPLPATSATVVDPGDADDRRLARVAMPMAVLAGVDLAALLALIAAVLAGWGGVLATVLIALAAVLLVGLGGGAVGAGIAGWRRPPVTGGAVSVGESGQVSSGQWPSGQVWQSRQQWIGPLAGGRERRLVTLACENAGRIIASDAWSLPELDDHRLTLDLPAELEQIDRQAFAIAHLRHDSGARRTSPDAGLVDDRAEEPADDPAWGMLVDHVAALASYAAGLERLDAAFRPGIPTAEGAIEARQSLSVGSVEDEFAVAHLRALTTDLAVRERAAGTR